MKQRLHFWLLTIGLILLGRGSVLYAQSPQTIEFGPHVGITTTLNDLNPWKPFSEIGLEYSGLVRYNYDKRWAFRLDYTHSNVKSTDTIAGWRPERMLNFRSTVNDLSVLVEFNFLNYYTGHRESSVSPYLFAGISVFAYDVHPYTGRKDLDTLCFMGFPSHLKDNELAEDAFFMASQYQMKKDMVPFWERHHISASIPFGFGCKFSLAKRLGASIEWRMHYTFTDYLDGVHGVYPDSHVVLNGYDLTDPSGSYQKYQQRGNSMSKDWFGSLSLAITWKIPLPGSTACKVTSH